MKQHAKLMIQNTSDRHVTRSLPLVPVGNVEKSSYGRLPDESPLHCTVSGEEPYRTTSHKESTTMPFLDVPSAGESSSTSQSDTLPHLKLKSSDPGPAAVPRKGAR